MTGARRITRRVALRGALATPLVLALGAPPGRAAPSWEAELRRVLAEIPLPAPGARYDLVGFRQEEGARGVAMEAVVRLTWAPGTRQRRFADESRDGAAAFAALARGIQAEFAPLGRGLS